MFASTLACTPLQGETLAMLRAESSLTDFRVMRDWYPPTETTVDFVNRIAGSDLIFECRSDGGYMSGQIFIDGLVEWN